LPRRAKLALALILCAVTANAAGTIFSTILSGNGQDYVNAVTSDAKGNVYVAGETYSNDFPVTTGAYQTIFGQTADAFVAKLGPDGKVIWATYLGGILTDSATGIALDSSGNVWVAGWTVSPNFPLSNPIQSSPTNGYDAFVAKFDPTGAKLLFSTFLGGQSDNSAVGIAVDSAGNAYVAVNTTSAVGFPGLQNPPDQPGIVVTKIAPHGTLVYSYFHPNGAAAAIALDSTGAAYVAGSTLNAYYTPSLESFISPALQQAIAFKISADGATKLYEKNFGDSTESFAAAIAVDSANEAWVAGSTASADFPIVHPLQSTLGARPLYESTNGGATWSPIDNLPFALPQMMAVDPTTPTTLYEATADLGVFKSTDGGATWTSANTGIASTDVPAITVDPVHAQTLYAANLTTVYKSTDGAVTWTAVDTPSYPVTQILVDAQNDSNVYTVCTSTAPGYQVFFRRSTDGGTTWANVPFPGTPGVAALALDPHVSGTLVAISNEVIAFNISGSPAYLYRSTDGGNTWMQIQQVAQPASPLIADASTTPTTFYDGLALRSVDGGRTWSAFPSLPGNSNTAALAADPAGTLYAAVSPVNLSASLYVSHDHGTTWVLVSSSAPAPFTLTTDGASGALFTVVSQLGTAGFVSKLSADGSTLLYSTYLRAHATLTYALLVAAEANVFYQQNWIAGIALDPSGNVVVTGGTRGTDFPVASPVQPANAGLADAFAAIISADGSTLNSSTYFGGSQDDGALAAGIDSTGNVILAGQTWSGDFPGGGGSLPYTYGDAFVVKLATGTPAISSVLNGASFQPGIESGSWAMIKGVNLANTTRIWTVADFSGANLPTSLSGVSVTIDGNPAFIYYISPTQINVQVPSDSSLAGVPVVVDNNGALNAPATVALQSYAPAFFMDPGTSYVIASRLPDYALVGNLSAPAIPGEILVLWATGFGPTIPAAPAGVEVSGAPATASAPTVTVGGMPARVVSSVLTTGTAGLYQITIQLPVSVPTGTVAVQASIGGVQTQAGVTLFIE
jgi:uncharacterized protein (TIGR03437 family)